MLFGFELLGGTCRMVKVGSASRYHVARPLANAGVGLDRCRAWSLRFPERRHPTTSTGRLPALRRRPFTGADRTGEAA